MPAFQHQGHRIAYTEYGSGSRTCMLIHGLLLSQRMHLPLAEALAEDGNGVVAIDLLGHGSFDRPRDMGHDSTGVFGQQLVALLDHLGLDEGVLGGTSLGAKTTLEVPPPRPSGAHAVPSRGVFWLEGRLTRVVSG